MHTYPVYDSEGRYRGFEIESVYISVKAIAATLATVPKVSNIRRRRLFASGAEMHVRFDYEGSPCVVWEPFGEISRYLIVPDDTMRILPLQPVEEAFARYVPNPVDQLIGDLLTLRLFRKVRDLIRRRVMR